MSNQNILVVDDEAKMRRLLEIMLTQMGHDVQQAEDGLAALEYLQAHRVDLVITDLKMPNLNGIDLLRRLREEDNDVPVIVVTAYGTVESAVEAMKYGASDYIIRPFELDAVEAAVKRALTLSKVQRENRFLRQSIEAGWGEFVGTSAEMQHIYTLIQQVAPTKTGVLIEGETGTGKELVARAIHRASPRASALFVAINCAAIPADILEGELFGYTKGAFTGANRDHTGKFELAEGGTLFLDEITEMDIGLQAKLLRVLQERSLERLGSNRTIPIDIRLIAASNRDPKQAISDNKLREDLYYRLNVFNIPLPPLRERASDILILANHFMHKHAQAFGYAFNGITPDAEAYLVAYQWPGNVRELENMMERAIVLSGGKTVTLEHLPQETITHSLKDAGNSAQCPIPITAPSDKNNAQPIDVSDMIGQVEALEKYLIEQALLQVGDNKAKTAQLLQISERSLWYKLKKYGLYGN